MLNYYQSDRQLPNKNMFSYNTAQQYCALALRSKEKARSISRDKFPSIGRRTTTLLGVPLRKQTPNNESKARLRHVLMRQGLKHRSISSQQSSCERSSLNGRKEISTKPIVRRTIPRGGAQLIKKQVPSYEEQHLIVNLQEENKQLRQSISETEKKIMRVRSSLDLQRESQSMQRQMYIQQVKKLRETLDMQAQTRSSTRLADEEDCSFGNQLQSNISTQQTE